MEEESWDTPATQTFSEQPMAIASELPEIKLFGRWSCDDIQISDISLEVRVERSAVFVLSRK